MSIFSLPVSEKGIISVSYIVKATCDNYVITPRNPLTLYTPCNVYSLPVLFNSKLTISRIFIYCMILKNVSVDEVCII